MVWVRQWAGTQLVNQGFLTFPEFLDEPQPQLKAFVLPPDPPPIMNARVEQYSIDEQQRRFQMDGTIRLLMDGTVRLESNLQSGNTEQ